MEKLTETAEEALKILQYAESRREHSIRCSRDIIRETKRMIHSIQVSEDCSGSREVLKRLVSELTADTDDVCAGPADDALSEYAEAMILDSVVKGWGVPSFNEIGISPRHWALGLADCLGEMRRIVLTSLMKEDNQYALSMFSDMEEVFNTIMMFDIPDPILPIRRKQDIARGVMERTRTDVTNAVIISKVKL
jgi:translin